jgi:hypothetical protein
MAVLRPAATLSKPFLIATWVKQEDSAVSCSTFVSANSPGFLADA